MTGRYTIAWFALMLVAILNGTLREFAIGKVVPELPAHQISTLTLIIFSGVFVWVLNRIWPIESSAQAWIIGAIWLVMTVLFEFGFGHFVAGHPWSRLVADYNLLAGRVWPLFLVWISICPWLINRYSQAA